MDAGEGTRSGCSSQKWILELKVDAWARIGMFCERKDGIKAKITKERISPDSWILWRSE